MNALAKLWAKNILNGNRQLEELDVFPTAFRDIVIATVEEENEKDRQDV